VVGKPTMENTDEYEDIWSQNRFSEEGADIVRDIKLAKFKEAVGRSRARSQSDFSDTPSMRPQGDDVAMWSSLATPGGFRRSFIQQKNIDIQYSFEPFISTCLFDSALPDLAGIENSNPEDTDTPIKGKIIGIGGGVGPAAGVALHSKIIQNTVTDGTDQSHFEVYHLSRSKDLPDRTRYVLELSDENPADGLARTMKALCAASSSFGQRAVAGIPCNTFHAPKIWSSFVEQVKESCGNRVKVVHMLDECLRYIKEACPGVRKIGVMSTTGTREAKVYDMLLAENGYEIIWVPEETQAGLHDAIYNKDWGIKAVFPVTDAARKKFLNFSNYLYKQGAQAIILGCTEIPLALPEALLPDTSVVLVDPVLALARALIREADPSKLKPMEPLPCAVVQTDLATDNQGELEAVAHWDKEEWLSENSLEGRAGDWDKHFKGRSDQDSELYKLLQQQQQDIKQLRSKVNFLGGPVPGESRSPSKTLLDINKHSFSFTNLRQLDTPMLKQLSGGGMNVVVGHTSFGEDLTKAFQAGDSIKPEGDHEILKQEKESLREHQQRDQHVSSPRSRRTSGADEELTKKMDKHMRIMIGLTMFCCFLLFITVLVAFQTFRVRQPADTQEL